MKILYVIGQLGRGGAEQQLYYLLKYLRPNAMVVSLTSGGYWAGPIRELGIEVVELERRGRADVSRLFALIRIIRRYKPDIIHAFTDNTHGLYPRLAAILTRHSCVIVGERAHPTYDPRWYILLRRWLLNQFVSYVISNSQAAHDFLISEMRLPVKKAVYIPNGIEIERILLEATEGPNPLPADWQGKLIIGTVGSLSPRKAPLTFLQVARDVLLQCPETRFVWVGDGELRSEVERAIDEMGLRHAVLLAGERHDVPRWLGAMDIFVLTSVLEGTPNAVMEAMATGLPCVVTDVGGNRDIIETPDFGLRVPVGDCNTFCSALIGLLSNDNIRNNLGDSARIQVQQYDTGEMAARYRAIYDQCVACVQDVG